MADEVNSPGGPAERPKMASTPESTSADDIDRRSIRKSRKKAAKKAKRIVRELYDDVQSARPRNSYPADQILRRAVEQYSDGPIPRRELKRAVSRLEATIRSELQDLFVLRAQKSASVKPKRVGIMVCETRAMSEGCDQIITVENHTVVLEEDRLVFVSGLLPGGTRPHLFERIFERGGPRRTMAEIQLQLCTVWPTLLWMRTEQTLHGRGSPITAVMTPFGDGLLFGNVEKIDGLPPSGPTVVTLDSAGQQTRQIHDYYRDSRDNRLWVTTSTYVDGTLLAPQQLQLRDELRSFVRNYPDVIADNNWKWRIGLGEADPAVSIVAETFRLSIPSEARRRAALTDLEAIVASASWQSVQANSLANRQQRRHRHTHGS